MAQDPTARNDGDQASPAWVRRARIAFTMGFVLVFAFALIMQLVADLVAWMTNTRVTFLFPLGIQGALVDPSHLVNVLTGLALVSLAMGAILFWRMTAVEIRSSAFDIHDRPRR